MDKKKRWGNSAMKGHGVNSPAMMEARKGFEKKKHELASRSSHKKEESSLLSFRKREMKKQGFKSDSEFWKNRTK